jgi:hypothetical protein
MVRCPRVRPDRHGAVRAGAYNRSTMAAARLSKSRIVAGLQCHKRLWLQVHRPELVVYGPATERVFAVGHHVGEIAQRLLHPGGTLIESQDNLSRAIRDTEAALADGGDVVLYEPAFSYAGVLVRVDLLARRGGEVLMVEVKSSTKVKDYQVTDAAIQAWVLRGLGLPVDRVAIAHIDSAWVYPGGGDYEGLLVEEDVTDAVAQQAARVWGWVDELRAVVAGDMPAAPAGGRCHDPFDCPLLSYCTADFPAYHVSLLPNDRDAAARLIEAGYDDLRAVPADWPFSHVHRRVWQATVSGEPFLDAGARTAVLGLAWPRYYLDFETIGFAVPVWAGTQPYRQLPFQWSCHIEREGGSLEHVEFLDVSGEPPLRPCAEALIDALGDRGPIMVYSGFEQARISELAERFPDLAPALQAIIARLFDLYPVAREHYYHPLMKGSWSLKAVLPTVAPDLDYTALAEVQDGLMAQTAYLEAIDAQTSQDRRETLRRAMLEYCAYDTRALVRLAHFFSGDRPPGS